MQSRIKKFVADLFVICDGLLGIWCILGLAVGVAFSSSLRGPAMLALIVAPVLGLAFWASAFAVHKGLSWQAPVRTVIYVAIMLGVVWHYIPAFAYGAGEWRPGAAIITVIFANLLLYWWWLSW